MFTATKTPPDIQAILPAILGRVGFNPRGRCRVALDRLAFNLRRFFGTLTLYRATVDRTDGRLFSLAIIRRSGREDIGRQETQTSTRPQPGHSQVAPRPAVAPIADAGPASRRLAAAALGVAVLAIYVRTLAPTVAGGDSGELITVAHTLGVAHPPGYPLYTLLAKLFTLLPAGTIAWRVNLFSAVCGAGAATILFLAVARWSGSLWAGLASASLFAFSPRVWPHSVTAEVFALNNVFLAGLVYLTVRSGKRAPRDVRPAPAKFGGRELGWPASCSSGSDSAFRTITR